MNDALHSLLSHYRENAKTEREKGTYFENLIKAYLLNDPLQQDQYSDAWTYADWAEQHGWNARDTGIDLVAKLRHEEGYCAIQCKFYAEDHRIQKGDIDRFFSVSGKEPIKRRLIVDSTRMPWGPNAEATIKDQTIPVNRIDLEALENSPINWAMFARTGEVILPEKRPLRDYQQTVLQAVQKGFAEHDRGKIIMACGTGKTFTSLRIAEDRAGKGKTVLYLVPSLALMSQTVTEWANDALTPIHAFAACSDSQVGKRRIGNADAVADVDIHDLAFPATTNPQKIAQNVIHRHDDDHMTVVFSTYQSIQVISDAQQKHGLPEFDLIICDEAHRTTGVTLANEDDSNFVKVHDQSVIAGKKRLYMTATPRIFNDNVKAKADEKDAILCSMDDKSLFGPVFDYISFDWAVRNHYLTDYKVIVLAVDEGVVNAGTQRRLSDETNSLKLDDATKIIGCYKALTKETLRKDVGTDINPMRRALAFCQSIKSSETVCNEFEAVIDEYLDAIGDEDEDLAGSPRLRCELSHVDGTFNAKSRTERLNWLKSDAGDDTCRILSNARCLSEGVDVPALDAIMFMHPRKSQIDVIQSVGRVMRKAQGKNMGYVILPVAIPAGTSAEQALNDNERYKVIWQILNALRAHDERFDAVINRASLGEDISDKIEITAIVKDLPTRTQPAKQAANIGEGNGHTENDGDTAELEIPTTPSQGELDLFIDEFSKAVLARIVKKCGTRDYWENWATDIAKIAQTHITRIKTTIADPGGKARIEFDKFLAELRDDLNDSITEDEAVEMLAQHVITRPVFETLFEGHAFTRENPISKAIQSILDVLDEHNLEKESKTLEKFYDSVKNRAQGIATSNGKQSLVVELYDKFFRNAFPRMTERLGIVYTPVEVVDFIIHSVNDVLKSEFDQTLGSKGVHIIDPFTGTGTFITRLLQSGLIAPEDLEHKFRHEIHANEIVLLAYYIAAINIESVFHDVSNRDDYIPFEGICLTDTFQMYETDDLISAYMPDNSERRKRQKETDIKVIIGNPPYSAGQGSANDNNANIKYKTLDEGIRDTYAAHSDATLKNALYDSYIRAIRWGSDRLKDKGGVMAYVTNAGWIDGNAMDGLRKCLKEEFTSLYIFHLRGNQRTSGELSRREGGKIFGSGSRSPIAITLFVKNPNATEHGKIWFHDIGDYLTRDEKLAKIQNFGSISALKSANAFEEILPDDHNDWLNQRDGSFDQFIKTGDKKDKSALVLFANYSAGLKTNRDAWCYNYSVSLLENNMNRTISFYNSEVERFAKHFQEHGKVDGKSFIDTNPSKISWDFAQVVGVERGTKISFDPNSIFKGIYRPFTAQFCYFNRNFNNRVYQMPSIFPEQVSRNLAISVSGVGAKAFTSLLVNSLPCLDMVEKGQCFPLKLYQKNEPQKGELFGRDPSVNDYRIKDGITDDGLAHFKAAYPNEDISKEDIFYYVYGLLHSEDYRARYADNLSKELPRIPCVKKAVDFWAFSKAGRDLGDLHVNYETVDPYPVTYKQGDARTWVIDDAEAFYRVEKMKFGGKASAKDKTTIIYNPRITLQDVPLEAYDYVVNGKPAIEWVMERQCVKTDKASGIVNDANLYAIETVGDPAYPLKLLERVITVSLETMKIVRSLPALDIDVPDAKKPTQH
ncbi:DEAD/DEAH box helicase [Thalassospira lohafexi]|uniref:Damage-inducible protein n=1 Tax=Thalassospira lohafexi TaxID=744227 RepID=A0A2N3L1P8_9PROT|nr:type ISP restriction/modification enzyme [Thalassospira lohafexi]PKR56722.1 damage-inducible protein [Thalassospira lohafexi]